MSRRRLPYERVLSRRAVLRGAVGGVAVALGLPMLEAMLDDHGAALADGAELPRRLLTWMFGNGCRLEHWTPKTEGIDYPPTEELAPLAQVKDYCSVLTGFRNYVAGRRGHHDGMAGLFGGHPFIQLDPMGAPYASKFGGKSIDQVAADLCAGDSFHKSLQLGVSKRFEASQGPTLQTMSHRGPDLPLPMERDPQQAYDLLFASFVPPESAEDQTAALRSSAIDAVLQDLQRLKKRVGKGDATRLDNHIESLFQLQKQIVAIPPTCDLPPKPGELDYNEDGSEPLWEINEVMSQLVTLAFACDLTRVVSYMFTGPSGGQWFHTLPASEFPEYPEAETADYSHSDQHQVSHMNLPYPQAFIHQSVVFSMKNLAALLERLKATPEGDGNLLDNCCVLAGSDVTEGWAHSEDDYPLIVAGRAGGRLRYQVGHYRSQTEESLSDVGLACLEAVVPDAEMVTEYGSDDGSFKGRSTTPCAAVLA